VTSERNRLGCPRGIELGCEASIRAEAAGDLEAKAAPRRVLTPKSANGVAVLPAAVKSEVRAFSRSGASMYPEGSVIEGILVATAALTLF
jgi:hypothetical protein